MQSKAQKKLIQLKSLNNKGELFIKSISVIETIVLAIFFTFAFLLSTVIAQNDTIYILKAGVVVGQYNINTKIDSVIIYKPT